MKTIKETYGTITIQDDGTIIFSNPIEVIEIKLTKNQIQKDKILKRLLGCKEPYYFNCKKDHLCPMCKDLLDQTKDVLGLIEEIKFVEQVVPDGWEDRILNELKKRITG